MEVDRVKISPNADLLSRYSSLSDEQRALIETMMERTYRDFVEKGAEGRGVSYEEFEPRAHGRIYSGNQALEAGLVDALGGFSTAVKVMKEELGLEDSDKVMLEIFPRPKTLWESISSGNIFGIAAGRSGLTLRSLLNEIQSTEIAVQWLLMPEVVIR